LAECFGDDVLENGCDHEAAIVVEVLLVGDVLKQDGRCCLVKFQGLQLFLSCISVDFDVRLGLLDKFVELLALVAHFQFSLKLS